MPAVVYAEWWRGKTDIREELLAAVIVEDMPPVLCRAAGEAALPNGNENGTQEAQEAQKAQKMGLTPTSCAFCVLFVLLVFRSRSRCAKPISSAG